MDAKKVFRGRVTIGLSYVSYMLYNTIDGATDTYNHRLKRAGHPVRSAIHKFEIVQYR